MHRLGLGMGSLGRARPPVWARLLAAAAANGAAAGTPFILADIGEGISEVEVLRWHVKKGDRVKLFDPLVEVQSDKATVEITSRYEGVVCAVGYAEGDMAAVGKPLCHILTEDAPMPPCLAADSTAGADSPPGPDMPENEGVSAPEGHDEGARDEQASKGTLAVPAVRRLAKEHGVDIASVTGTGPGGRVTKEDIYRYINEPHVAADADEGKVAALQADSWVSRGRQIGTAAAHGSRTEKIRGLRRAMVKSMTASALIPQLGLGEEVSMDALYALRQELKPLVQASGVRLTYLPFFIKAASLALADFPLLNASVDEACETITYHQTHNISVAMDTSDGLVVPNVKHVDELSIVGIARELGRLSAEATQSPPRFSQEDLAGGTFALSNIGSIGGTYSSPVVMPPQVAIGALGRMRTTVVAREDADGSAGGDIAFDLGRVLHVSWSADHRVVDGATIANFSNAWKRYVESPHLMLLHLK